MSTNAVPLTDEKRHETSSHVPVAVILTVLISVQALYLVFLGTQKQEFHIDEIYSYLFSNSVHAESFSFADWLFDDWVSGEEFDSLTTVQKGEGLRYDAPYRNTALDCHPPLYYWALHTASLFLPGVLSKWIGIGLNVALFCIAQLLLYRTCKYMTESDAAALTAVVLYGFSAFAINTVLYARMYMLMTLLVILFVYQNLVILRDGPSVKNVVPAAITLYLGAMTQYYFLVFAFWFALVFGLVLLRQGRVREALIYGISYCLAVVAMLMSFPYAIAHVMGTSTNNIGNEISRSALDFKLWGYQVVELAKLVLGGFCFSVTIDYAFVAVLILGLIVVFAKSDCAPRDYASTIGFDVWWLLASILLTVVSIAKIGGHYVYIRYILFIVPLLYLCVITICMRLTSSHGATNHKLLVGMAALLVLVALAGAVRVAQKGNNAYTYEVSAQNTVAIVKHKDDPLVMILAHNSDGDVEVTGNYTRIRQFDRVYVGSKEEILSQQVVRKGLADHGALVLYIGSDTYWIEGYNPDQVIDELSSQLEGATVEYIVNTGFGDYYRISAPTQ